MRHIIVDGYNVIRADPRFLALERVSLERAREVLVQTLGSSPRLRSDEITVVFDGAQGPRRHVHSHRVGRVTVLYSGHGQKADDVIVEQAGRHSTHEQVVVVSNDVSVRESCRAVGALISSSENLLQQMPGAARTPRRIDEEIEPANTLSTEKRGNPRRSSRRQRRQREIRF